MLDPDNPEAGFALEYRDGSRCQGVTGSATAKYRKTIVELYCDKSAAVPQVMRVSEGTAAEICTYRAQVAAFGACATRRGYPAPMPPSAEQ